MRKPIILLTAIALTVANFALVTATPARAQTQTEAIEPGKPLYDVDGKRVGAIYRVAVDGSPQLIVAGKMVIVPVSSVSVNGGRVVTSMTRKELFSR